MKRKSFLAIPIAAAAILAGCAADPPPAPVVPVTPPAVTETETVTATPSPSIWPDFGNDDESRNQETQPPKSRPDETFHYIDCVDQGMNTSDWNTLGDTPTRDELELGPDATVTQPTVDAPVVEVAAWPGKCFETVMFTIDTTMIDPSIDRDDPNFTDRPWFDVRYVPEVQQDGSGYDLPLAGDGELQVTFYAKGSSFQHWSGHIPPNLINVPGFQRDTSDNFTVIREIAGAGDFENVVTFGLGVDRERPFAAHFVDNGDKTALVVRVALRQ